MENTAPSSKQVKKAGSKVRKFFRGDSSVDLEGLDQALRTIEAHRAQFSDPLTRVNNRLRQRLMSAGSKARVTQRLKKMPTILDKLRREPRLDLSRMRDIGGCRIVLDDLQELDHVHAAIVSNWRGGTEDPADYVRSPRESGYRAVHCFVRDHSTRLTIEVQLRTTLMHAWAEDVENVSARMGINYKQDGGSEYQEYMKNLSSLYEAVETGSPVPEGLADTLRTQRARIAHLVQRAERSG
ncbi:RelA/SpoT domain-containing protein [Nesterenkonia natronophila]|uniref:RelA/SpoT domain-containing protein n=1 Tax=Nesterenkonia natronophila TaxID=2174932 RepID=A0A3A4F1F6_9MICC|nr:RelA/SpoT domain-containing protein [Nesterenkonia natronophila]RJN31893.1 hypothetical protein D3250_07205 [Nesterenkonia natronophila]